MFKRIFTYIILMTFCAFPALAQDVVVEATLDSASILIGEQLKLKAVVSCEKGAKVKFSNYDKGEILPGLEVLKASQVDTAVINDGKRWELTREYTLTAFDSAVYSIPRFEVDVNGKKFLSRAEMGLKVNTVEVDMEHPEQMRPLKAPVDIAFVWSPRIVLLCLLPIIALLVFFVLAVRVSISRPIVRRVKVVPPTPPQQTAIAAIDNLKASEKEGEKQKEYYMQLTDILRSYIVERFGFNAREMTTGEILDHLRSTGDNGALEELQQILTTADLVKFAKYEASLLESDRNLLQAAQYVQTTKIEVPADQQPTEKIVEVGDVVGRRIKRTMLAAMAATAALGTAALGYVVFLLWETFM